MTTFRNFYVKVYGTSYSGRKTLIQELKTNGDTIYRPDAVFSLEHEGSCENAINLLVVPRYDLYGCNETRNNWFGNFGQRCNKRSWNNQSILNYKAQRQAHTAWNLTDVDVVHVTYVDFNQFHRGDPLPNGPEERQEILLSEAEEILDQISSLARLDRDKCTLGFSRFSISRTSGRIDRVNNDNNNGRSQDELLNSLLCVANDKCESRDLADQHRPYLSSRRILAYRFGLYVFPSVSFVFLNGLWILERFGADVQARVTGVESFGYLFPWIACLFFLGAIMMVIRKSFGFSRKGISEYMLEMGSLNLNINSAQKLTQVSQGWLSRLLGTAFVRVKPNPLEAEKTLHIPEIARLRAYAGDDALVNWENPLDLSHSFVSEPEFKMRSFHNIKESILTLVSLALILAILFFRFT